MTDSLRCTDGADALDEAAADVLSVVRQYKKQAGLRRPVILSLVSPA